jgi:D-alanyl-lipoteichoic acid acyltransferase DltB (MBOAT superfamily)
LAGPIVRANQFLPQLEKSVKISSESIKLGVTLMSWGFIKKFVIADNCAPIVNAIFSHPLDFTSLYIILGTILFGIQIYCDFSGYIDIALGVSSLIGFHLPINFLRPYLSQNPTEFWRRWNITLSSFIRDYLYIPLGGNRKGTVRKYINLEISMLLCGLWHGAAWNFVFWGGYHGALLAIHKWLPQSLNQILKNLSFHKYPVELFVKIFITQYFIFLGWILFRVGNIPDIFYCVKKYILFDFDLSTYIKTGQPIFDYFMATILNLNFYFKLLTICLLILLLIICLTNEFIYSHTFKMLAFDWIEFFSGLKLNYWIIFLISSFLILFCFIPSANPEFIYFQF